MSDLVSGDIGPQAKYKVEFSEGKLVLSLLGDSDLLDAEIKLKVEAKLIVNALIDKLEEVIPGDQKMIADMLKLALEKLG